MPLTSDSGARDNLITFERATETRDSMNAPVKTWATIGAEWASSSYGTGQERRSAAQERGSLTATFRVLRNPFTESLTIEDRMQFNGTWDIASIVPAEGRASLDITATTDV